MERFLFETIWSLLETLLFSLPAIMVGSFEVDAIKFSLSKIGAGFIFMISGSGNFFASVLSTVSELFFSSASFK